MWCLLLTFPKLFSLVAYQFRVPYQDLLTAHANGYYGAWPEWAVTVNVLPLTNLPARQEPQETWVRSLGREDPLAEGMATHSSTLDWRILWTEEPGGSQSQTLLK